jgi:hypothetical protein
MNERAMADQVPVLGPIAARFGLALEELEHLTKGPVQELFARIVRFNSRPQRTHRINAVVLYATLIDVCAAREQGGRLSAPSPE